MTHGPEPSQQISGHHASTEQHTSHEGLSLLLSVATACLHEVSKGMRVWLRIGKMRVAQTGNEKFLVLLT